MSFIVLQPTDVRTSRPGPASFSRCGSGLIPFDVDHNAIPRSLFGAMLGGDDDDDVVFDEAPSLTPWQHHHHLEQLRRQEYLHEVERRRRILVARQQQAELERQIERARAEKLRREKAARLAWHQEQQRRAAVALEYQRRVEAYKRRQEEEYAQRVRLAQQAHQARQAAQAQQAQKQKEFDWEKVAAQSIFGVINLVQHLFGEQQAETTTETTNPSKVDGKRREKTTEEVNAEQAKKDTQVEADAMQVDQSDSATRPAKVDLKQAEEPTKAEEAVAVPEEAAPASTSETVAAQEEEKQLESSNGRLVFTYPLPQDEATRSSIKPQDIGVSYDEDSHTIQLIGLWPDHSSSSNASSSDNGHDEGRGRKRSRSPKHSRVSDVDEKTGEEIVKPEENDEGFVEVPEVQPATTIKSIRLPQDAKVAHLRAELTDDGFKVYV